MRILIDNREIFTGEESKSLLHAFAKGVHTLEIEYKNDWHTITFSVLFAPARHTIDFSMTMQPR